MTDAAAATDGTAVTRPRLIEYRDCTDDVCARQQVLETKQGARNTYELVHSTAGYECAGAAMRWTDEYYAVRFFDHALNAMYGKRFSKAEDAWKYLASRQ